MGVGYRSQRHRGCHQRNAQRQRLHVLPFRSSPRDLGRLNISRLVAALRGIAKLGAAALIGSVDDGGFLALGDRQGQFLLVADPLELIQGLVQTSPEPAARCEGGR